MKRILIVEDVEINMDLVIQLLEDKYELIIATDGVQAVAQVEENRPDLILMDMALPIMDGWEATRRIKANKALRHIPIIGLSAHAMSGDADRALQAGCDDYLTKPLDEGLLLEKLDHFLS